MLQIGEVAECVGLSLRTVRYYEEMGLLAPADRTDGGFRLYTGEQVERLGLIKRMKPLGFSVEEMAELLDARDTLRDPQSTKAAADKARDQLAAFATAAAESCQQLRAQLDHAEEFANRLREETRHTPPSVKPGD